MIFLLIIINVQSAEVVYIKSDYFDSVKKRLLELPDGWADEPSFKKFDPDFVEKFIILAKRLTWLGDFNIGPYQNQSVDFFWSDYGLGSLLINIDNMDKVTGSLYADKLGIEIQWEGKMEDIEQILLKTYGNILLNFKDVWET